MAFKRPVADLLTRRDSHDIAGLQVRIVPDRRLALHGYRPEPEKVLRLLRDNPIGSPIRYGSISHLDPT